MYKHFEQVYMSVCSESAIVCHVNMMTHPVCQYDDSSNVDCTSLPLFIPLPFSHCVTEAVVGVAKKPVS